MSPFLTVGAVGEYDVESEVIGGGHSGKRLPFQTDIAKISMPQSFLLSCFIGINPEMPTKLFPLTFLWGFTLASQRFMFGSEVLDEISNVSERMTRVSGRRQGDYPARKLACEAIEWSKYIGQQKTLWKNPLCFACIRRVFNCQRDCNNLEQLRNGVDQLVNRT